MLKLFILFFLFFQNTNSQKLDSSTGDSVDTDLYCCQDYVKKRLNTVTIANYDCSQLTLFGKARCNSVFGGRVCNWNKCKIPEKKCSLRKKRNRLQDVRSLKAHIKRTTSNIALGIPIAKTTNQKIKIWHTN